MRTIKLLRSAVNFASVTGTDHCLAAIAIIAARTLVVHLPVSSSPVELLVLRWINPDTLMGLRDSQGDLVFLVKSAPIAGTRLLYLARRSAVWFVGLCLSYSRVNCHVSYCANSQLQ